MSTTISLTEFGDRLVGLLPAPAETTVASEAPYLEALQRYSGRRAGRFHVPGHKGGAGAPAQLVEALGGGLELDVRSCIEGIDLGPGETPLQRAERLAAQTWGARRTIHKRDFPAFAVDESSIFGYLERAGVELEDVEVRSVASEDLASDPGYEGLLFVAGRLPG